MTAAVILAAGAGRRLGDLGRSHSKAMLPIAGRPLIAWVIDRLYAASIERLVVVGHPSDDGLAAFLHRDHPATTLVLQPERRGIADALRRALPALADETAYLACACDSVFATADIRALVERGSRQPGAAAVAVLEMGRAATATRSAVRVDGERVIAIVEKPAAHAAPSGLVAMPLYWLPREIDADLQRVAPQGGEVYIATALNDFIARGGTVFAVPVSDRVEVTTPEDLEHAARALGKKP